MSNVHSLFPIIRPRSDRDRVLVVGAGVSGLTSALSLARAGIEVEVLAEKFQSDLVSVVAGALWEWPPAVCGYPRPDVAGALEGVGDPVLRDLLGPRPRPGHRRLHAPRELLLHQAADGP